VVAELCITGAAATGATVVIAGGTSTTFGAGSTTFFGGSLANKVGGNVGKGLRAKRAGEPPDASPDHNVSRTVDGTAAGAGNRSGWTGAADFALDGDAAAGKPAEPDPGITFLAGAFRPATRAGDDARGEGDSGF